MNVGKKVLTVFLRQSKNTLIKQRVCIGFVSDNRRAFKRFIRAAEVIAELLDRIAVWHPIRLRSPLLVQGFAQPCILKRSAWLDALQIALVAEVIEEIHNSLSVVKCQL